MLFLSTFNSITYSPPLFQFLILTPFLFPSPQMASVFPLVLGILVVVGGVAVGYDGGGDMEEGELFALFEVMGSLLDDPTWAENHPLPCTETPWPGVECGLMEETSVFHVTKIHVGDDVVLPPCKPSAKLSLSLLKLPYLRTLSLINCFTHSPLSLTKLTFHSLEHLTLQSNPALTGEIPPTISNLTSLKTLCLSQNNLTGQIPQEIGHLFNLQQLVLSHNNLTGAIPPQIGAMKELTILDLSFNSLQQTVPASIGELTLLEKIDLSWNKLRGAPPPEIGRLTRLVLLDLSHNSLNGPIPENLSGLEQLQYLIMEANPLNSPFPSLTNSLTRLLVLSLSDCGLFGPIPTVFSKLSNLTTLSLDNNNLNGPVPREIGLLQNLGTLNLSRNHLKGQLLFPQEFIDRIGARLDIRENEGLCAKAAASSTRSRFVENPRCGGEVMGNKNRTVEDKNQDLYSDDDSGADRRDSDGKIISLLLLLLLFL